MNTLKLVALATAATIVMTPSGIAGAGPHRMPAGYGRLQPSYELKINREPMTGQPMVVSLIDRANGQIVRDGEVVVMRPVYVGQKAVPTVQQVPEVLPQDAEGNFICAGDHHVAGERLTLRGEGPSGTAPVWLTLQIKG